MYFNEKVALLILDGWGHGQNPEVSAIAQAQTPFVDSLYKKYPNAELITHGEQVGLPGGQMGNSEVGHLNIGAGRVVYQELLRINNAVKDKTLDNNSVLKEAMDYAKANNKPIHLMGLVSDGGVHSHIDHIKGLCDILNNNGLEKVYIHAFTDGRDTDPNGGLNYLKDLQNHLENSTGKIASIVGRYYAMDRDKRWERIKLAYDLLIKGQGTATNNFEAVIQASYDEGVTDEFLQPISVLNEKGAPTAIIEEGDVVICFNYRTDRCRQITTVLTQKDMPDAEMKTIPLHYVTMTRYDNTFEGVKVIFEKDNLQNTLGEVLERNGKRQIRMAETEKYPHVTFFFSGGREAAFEGEERIVMPSPKVATYDLQPEMSANELTEAILTKMEAQAAEFICLNFANTDMVGHTGVFEAGIKAAETVDNCVRQIVDLGLQKGYAFIIIADHGNADMMQNPDGSPNTAHTTNLVPIFLVANGLEEVKLKSGKLGDVATTILNIMGLEIPEEMTGEVLVEAK
ncbi:MAG: 2,3-bisphosphoglycerate-independent phosphoglycerate mutase [Chitinophagales bacterium]